MDTFSEKHINNNKNKAELCKFLIDSISYSFNCYKENFNVCKKEFSEESVHDYRVSIRRLLSLINLINKIFPEIDSNRIKKVLKKQLKIMNPLRDNQVQILKIRNMAESYPILYLYYNNLVKQEEELIKSIVLIISKSEFIELEGNCIFLKNEIRKALLSKYSDFQSLISLATDLYYQVIELIKVANRSDLQTIHKVRLQFKKYRYTIETIQPIIDLKKPYLKKMKHFQTILGKIQDNKVLVTNLEEFTKTCPNIPQIGRASCRERV